METGVAMIVKQRAKANQIESMDLIGNVDGCDCIIGKVSTTVCSAFNIVRSVAT